MNLHFLTGLRVVIVVAAMASCNSQQKESQTTSTDSKDTLVSQSIKPTESGYAEVNGLRMYFEVYGNGKPIVLLHGSYMNIPLNWQHIIPLLA